jgi:glycosyltransferase involved in cell wall biosynthesis
VREGWGLNVSEAAACGTPTIGYAVPGLVDSIPASGGILVPPNSAALGQRLVDFFSGSLSLTPRTSTVPWATVADAVEAKLERVIHAAGRG